MIRSGESVWSFPNVAVFLLGGPSLLLAAVVVAWLTSGWQRRSDLAPD